MPLVDTSDNNSHSRKQHAENELADTLRSGGSLVVELNGMIRAHYPPGEVDYPEVIRALVSLAVSYRRAGIELGMPAADVSGVVELPGQVER